METKNISSLQVLRSEDRGQADHGWLKARHSFSFANYYNPAQMGFRSLRVINQDTIAAGGGFPMHAHRDMEIFTYIVEGALSHEDSMGNKGSIRPGEIQLMSAGSGVRHSEFNPSRTEHAELLQIWIQPREANLEPSYTDWTPNEQQRAAAKSLLISPDGREESAIINQDAYIYRVKLAAGESVSHQLAEKRGAWLQLVRGELTVNDTQLTAGDAAFTELAGELQLTSTTDAEALLFDLF